MSSSRLAAAEGIDIVMTTAYRSYEFQEILWNYNVGQKGRGRGQ